jgi:hypothetical protein
VTATPCAHGCGLARPPAHHYRDVGDLDPELAVALGYCPVLARPTTEETPDMDTIAPPEQQRANRLDELEAGYAARRLSKRELRRKLARAEWLLEVRDVGTGRVLAHNNALEARLRTLGYAELATLGLDDIDARLVDRLRLLGDAYGPRGVILAALTVLGGRP